eukprot:2196990-Rhodomonas_salina.6
MSVLDMRRIMAEMRRSIAEMRRSIADMRRSKADMRRSKADMRRSKADMRRSIADMQYLEPLHSHVHALPPPLVHDAEPSLAWYRRTRVSVPA